MNHSHADTQVMPRMPKILYVEDQLPQNVSRLLRLFKDHIRENERERLTELERDPSPYPEQIKQVFDNVQGIDVEYRFPEALAKIQENPEQYNLFIIDRNLSDADYRLEEVQKIEPQYSQEVFTRFSDREGDYILFKLATCGKVDILKKFYFLTAYLAEDEIRSAPEVKKFLMDFGVFQKENFIEKGNKAHLSRLIEAIKNSLMSTMYVFKLNDGSIIRGSFVSAAVNVRTGNGKISLSTAQFISVANIDEYPRIEFIFNLKSGDSVQGRFADRRIIVNTQINPNQEIVTNNIHSIQLI